MKKINGEVIKQIIASAPVEIKQALAESKAFAIEFPDIEDTTSKRDPNVPSIRRICREGILLGKSTASIAAVIKQYHPDSAAAAKSSKHIGYYRAQLKAEGKLSK